MKQKRKRKRKGPLAEVRAELATLRVLLLDVRQEMGGRLNALELMLVDSHVAAPSGLLLAVRQIAATGTTEDLSRIVRMIDDAAGSGEGGQ